MNVPNFTLTCIKQPPISTRHITYLNKINLKNALSLEDSNICEGNISYNECKYVVFNKISGNKSPGLDGLPIEFYHTFWNSIGNFLIKVYDKIFEKGELSNS